MSNEELIKLAIETLQKLDPKEIETIQVSNTKYDDNSQSLEIAISWPPE